MKVDEGFFLYIYTLIEGASVGLWYIPMRKNSPSLRTFVQCSMSSNAPYEMLIAIKTKRSSIEH